MYEALLHFLSAVGRLPGGGAAVSFREWLREREYRRNAWRGRVDGTRRAFENAGKAGRALLAGTGTPVASPTPSEAKAAVPLMAADSADADKTRAVLRPRPGGRTPPLADHLATLVQMNAAARRPASRGCALNPLVEAGTALLLQAASLRRAAPADVRELRLQLARDIEAFDAAVTRTQTAPVAPEHAVAARYTLCTLLDEAVLSTPWGAESPWGQHSLLTQFHHEAWGGEKCFQILERLLADPVRHLPALEFIALCLAMGLQGRWRVAEGGALRLQEVQRQLHQAIAQARALSRSGAGRELSPRWQPATVRGTTLTRLLPLWVAAAVAGVAVLGLYLAMTWRLSLAAEPVYARLAALDAATAVARTAAPPVARTVSLREALAGDIAAGRVAVIEQARGSTLVLRGDAAFAAGSDAVDPALQPVLQRIGTALNRFEGPVQVTGHTDDQPIGTTGRLRFASNWALSQARAKAVSTLLARWLERPTRLSAEGRADAEPLVPNDNTEHRARNRRVDITLLAPNATAAATAATAP